LCDKDGQSPLYIASVKGECDVVKCLLSSGWDINVYDEDGQSPLFIASYGKENVMMLNVYLVLMQISICVTNEDNHHCL
jgi:ankyrin repeat protein